MAKQAVRDAESVRRRPPPVQTVSAPEKGKPHGQFTANRWAKSEMNRKFIWTRSNDRRRKDDDCNSNIERLYG